jgi:hypothetical protein
VSSFNVFASEKYSAGGLALKAGAVLAQTVMEKIHPRAIA